MKAGVAGKDYTINDGEIGSAGGREVFGFPLNS